MATCQICEKKTRKRYALRLVGRLYFVCKKCYDQVVKERGF